MNLEFLPEARTEFYEVFPYYIAYFVRGDLIVIAAVAHGSRHPDYWKRRLQ
jgi:plasmid stabilization system protein ParE